MRNFCASYLKAFRAGAVDRQLVRFSTDRRPTVDDVRAMYDQILQFRQDGKEADGVDGKNAEPGEQAPEDEASATSSSLCPGSLILLNFLLMRQELTVVGSFGGASSQVPEYVHL